MSHRSNKDEESHKAGGSAEGGQETPADEPLTLSVRRGSLYVSCDIYARYFQDLAAVILLRNEDDLLVMPVRHAAAGGYLLKLKNARGDRVVNAMDFFRAQGLDDFFEARFAVRWSTEKAALIAEGLFS